MINESRSNRDEDTDIPSWLRWTFISINRVGFPVVAFFFMWYMSTVSLRKITDTMEKQSLSLEALIVTVNGNHVESKEWRDRVLEDIRRIQEKLNGR